jgi:hypothetical protein
LESSSDKIWQVGAKVGAKRGWGQEHQLGNTRLPSPSAQPFFACPLIGSELPMWPARRAFLLLALFWHFGFSFYGKKEIALYLFHEALIYLIIYYIILIY